MRNLILSLPGSTRRTTRRVRSIAQAVAAVRSFAQVRGVSPLAVAFEVV